MKNSDLIRRFEQFQKAISRLKESFLLDDDLPLWEHLPKTKKPVLSGVTTKDYWRHLLQDSAIQRFEFTFEMVWKCLRLWLKGKDIMANNPRDAIKEALAQGLIEDGDGWTEMQENRNITTHTYDESDAGKVFSFIKEKGIILFEALEKTLKDSLHG